MNKDEFDAEVVTIVRDLRKMVEDVQKIAPDNEGLPALKKAILTMRLALEPNHPMHPNQDQDDVPELGDPRA